MPEKVRIRRKRRLSDYQGIVTDTLMDEIVQLSEWLRGARVVHINATAFGGGVAEILQSLVPLTSSVGVEAEWRVMTGGDEFFLLLPGTTNEGALAIAEAIRAAVADLAIPHPASPVSPVVTLSLGLASIVPPPTTEASQFIASADKALYRTKQQGRNRVNSN